MTVRTRFAPSPTGDLHVGGVRTALFAWLYARHHQGQFILRIEDTDTLRSTQSSVDAILKGMAWLGLKADEGPYFQSQRLSRYQTIIQNLLNEGKAYRCVCSKDRLEKLRESQLASKEKPKYDGCCRDKEITDSTQDFVIRFKTPNDGEVSFVDEVYGAITVANNELDDVIIQRSDGSPTYNFVVVVDDWEMGISHVIRGDDHINNTPRQINLFKALNAPVPTFAHLPMILGEDGKRLSKRHGAVSVLNFKEMGILPQTLLNYLVRLGWSSGDKEIFSLEEMVREFSLKSISRGSAAFNYEKLRWLNQHYLKTEDPGEISQLLSSFYAEQGIDISNGPELKELVPLLAERSQTLVEMVDKSHYFFLETLKYDEPAVKKHLKYQTLAPLSHMLEGFQKLDNWEKQRLHQLITTTAKEFELKMGKVAQPLRVAVTGGTMSPSIDLTLELLGKEKVVYRLTKALEKINNSGGEQIGRGSL